MTDARRFSRDALSAIRAVAEHRLTALNALWERQIKRAGVLAAERFALTAAAEWQPPVEGAAITEAQLAALAAALNKDLIPIWTRVVLDTANPPLATIEISWDVKHPAARRLIDQAAKRTGARLDETVQLILRDTIQTAYEQGLSVRETSAMIQGKISDAAPWQADMLARCLPGETFVDGAVVRAVTRRWFEGDVATVTTESGREFTATPNHPMLTKRGWLGAGELHEGDDLICGGRKDQPRASRHQDVAERPSTIAEIFEAALAVGILERRHTGDPDFHGDGIEGEVDIARPHRELTLGNFAPLDKQRLQHVFPFANEELETMCCSECGRLISADQEMCRCTISQWDSRLFETVNDHDARHAEGESQRLRSFAVEVATADLLRRELLDVIRGTPATRVMEKPRLAQSARSAAALLDPSQHRRLLNAETIGDQACAQPVLVHSERVKTCRVRSFRGYVYNLHTADGYFIANGAYTGNTDLVSLSNGASKAAASEAGIGFKTWLATLDDKTRVEHAEADGQTVPIDDTFLVGGEEADYPGDPALSDAMACSCRCSLGYGSTLDEAQALLSDAGGTIMADMASTRTRAKRQSRRAAKAPTGQEALLAPHPEIEIALSASDTVTISDDSGPLISVRGDALAADLPEEEAPSVDRKTALVAAPQAIPFDGVAAIEGKVSDDNSLAPRVILPNALSWPEMPVSFMAQTVTAEGHDGAEVAGRVDSFARKRAKRGMFDIAFAGELTTLYGVNEIAPMIEDKTMRYVSADLGASEWAIVDRKTLKEVPEEDLDINALQDGAYALGCTAAKMKGVTLVTTQAIEGAMVSLTASADESGIGISDLTSDEIITLVASGSLTLDRDIQIVFPQALALSGEAITASVDDWSPPRDWFDMPELPGKMPLTVTKEGRVYGHLACWDSCHVSFLPSCLPPPKSASNYAYFHVCEIDTDEGDMLTVGKLMFSPTDGGHADRGLSAAKASRYYDRTGMVAAFGRVSDGAHGIWFAGSINPRLTPEQRQEMRRELRMNPPSGDWRPINGQYELICGLAVAVPGFPTPRTTITVTASAEGFELQDAIIASSGRFDADPQALFVAQRMGIADEEALAERRMRALAARAEGGIDALAALAGGES